MIDSPMEQAKTAKVNMQKSSKYSNLRALLRERFLSEVWLPYPSLHFSVVPVNEMSKQTTNGSCIGGRFYWFDQQRTGFALRFAGREERFMNGEDVALSLLDQDAVWKPVAGFPLGEVLIDGDLVVAEIGEGKAGSEIKIQKIALVAPCLGAPPPPLSWTLETSRQWHQFLDSVRKFFFQNDFVEINSPTLVAMPSFEAHIESFALLDQPCHLPTSPEIHLKKLLVQGWNKIFEIRPCFRKDLPGPIHQPEFFMLEWYRGFSNLDVILDDLKRLLRFLMKEQSSHLHSESVDILEITVAETFARFLGFTLVPNTSEKDLRELARQQGVFVQEDDLFEDLFFRLFLEFVEPQLGKEGPTIVRSYPPQLAALARLDRAGWADRAELYWKGIEIANGFDELNDPGEHQKRLTTIQSDRARFGCSALPVDPHFFSAIRFGLAPSGGMALGLDRLFMVLNGLTTIIPRE